MALNFPANPLTNDTYSNLGTTWQFDGTAWNVVSATPSSQVNSFSTVTVAGQNDVIADQPNDVLTLIAGSNVTLTTDNTTDTVTINSTGGGGGGGAIYDQSLNTSDNVTFNSLGFPLGQTINEFSTDGTLSDASNSAVPTENAVKTYVDANVGGGSSSFSTLTDAVTANIDISEIYESAIVTLRVDNSGTLAYTFTSHYSGSNPTIYAISGTTIAFDLTNIGGHPFQIQDSIGNPYNTGLVHIAPNGTITTGANANNKDSGTLYWRINESDGGTFRYQCTNHIAMVGPISVKRLSLI